MKNAAKVAIPILLLFMLPSAMGTFEIQQGPSAIAASPGATAWGGKMQFTDPDGNTQDGNYFALMGLTAIAFVPDGEQGSAYANFYNQYDKFEKTQKLWPGDVKGSNVKLQMQYTGSAGANVEKTRTAGNALGFAAIGAGVGDFAQDPQGGTEAIDTAVGASGMMAVLSLPDAAVGNAGAAGAAGYNVAKIGNTVMVPGVGLANDEVLEVYGNTLGKAEITGPGQLVNGAAAAQNTVLGLSALGTASFATDFYGLGPNGEEGQGLTASGMLSLARANGLTPTDFDDFDLRSDEERAARIKASAEGTTDGGFWDGATPLGTSKLAGANGNENARTQTTGKVSSEAHAYLLDDFAASHSILANIGFHSNSPVWLDSAIPKAGREALSGVPGTVRSQNEKDGIGKPIDAYSYLERVLYDVANCHPVDVIPSEIDEGTKENIQKFMPEIKSTADFGDDPIVAINLALTSAQANRATQGNLNSPILTAESYIDADSIAQANHDGDRSVVSKMDKGSLGSGAHLRSMPGDYASTGVAIQAAGQFWPVAGVETAHGNLAVYGAFTRGPPYNGDRWNDAGTYVKFEEGMMESSKGTEFYRTTNGPLGPEGAITWIEGGDLNPQIRGQSYNSLFEDSTTGSIQGTLKADGLGYLESPQNRNTAWVSATIHSGI